MSWRLVMLVALSGVACANTTTFHTNPRGARIYVNGEPCGESPCKYDTRYGFPDRIRVQIEKEGYQPAEFFLDTVPPIATYALFGFGSYLFHTFDEEYRFDLRPTPGEPDQPVAVRAPAAVLPPAAIPAAEPTPAATPAAASAPAGADLTDPDAAMAMAAGSAMELANGQGDCAALAQPTLAAAIAHFGERATLRKQVTCNRTTTPDVHACEAELIGEDFAVYVRFFATAKGAFAPRCYVAGAGQR